MSRKLHVWLLCLAAAAASTSSCQRKKKPQADEARTVRVLPRPELPMRVLSEEVVGPGADPKTLVRYRAVPTREQIIRIDSVAEVREIENTAKAAPLSLPAVSTGYVFSWRGDGGQLIVMASTPEIASGGAEETAKAEQLIGRYRETLAGKSVALPVDSRGILGGKPLASGESELGRAFLASVADFVVPFPETPIGVGASWKVVRAVPRAKSNVKQTMRYKLVSREGDVLVIEFSGLLVGERQRLDDPNAPAGAHGELVALRANVRGELTVNLNSPAAISGSFVRDDAIHTRWVRGAQVVADYFSESKATVTVSTR